MADAIQGWAMPCVLSKSMHSLANTINHFLESVPHLKKIQYSFKSAVEMLNPKVAVLLASEKAHGPSHFTGQGWVLNLHYHR